MINDIPHVKTLQYDMIIKKQKIKEKKDGTPLYDYSFNKEFWEHIDEPINIVIDEAHTIFNSRRAMSKINIIMGQFMSMARRVIGSAHHGYGDLVLITQLSRRIDPIARDMAHQVRYHVCYWKTFCLNCRSVLVDHSENCEPYFSCPRCKSYNMERKDFYISIWNFKSIEAWEIWNETGRKTWYKLSKIENAERMFNKYNTHQWDNLFEEV
jgi:hypothetical protein